MDNLWVKGNDAYLINIIEFLYFIKTTPNIEGFSHDGTFYTNPYLLDFDSFDSNVTIITIHYNE